MREPVVVGVDGTPSSLAAVEAAAWEADRRGVGLQLAYAVAWPSDPVPAGGPAWDPDGAGPDGALSLAEERARRVAPGLPITSEVLVGEPAAVLESESRHATLTVVGGASLGRFGGPARDSVAGRLTAHGSGPVLVVRGTPRPGGPVVLVDDASTGGRDVAAFAFAEAGERGVDLVVLHVDGQLPHLPFGPVDGTKSAHRAATLSVLCQRHPDVTVRLRSSRGRTGTAVEKATAGAQLVVVGARGRGRVAEAVRGSAGRAVLRHARCPVAVVPTTSGAAVPNASDAGVPTAKGTALPIVIHTTNRAAIPTTNGKGSTTTNGEGSATANGEGSATADREG
ncbi:universal stress protein [Streptomyces sp. H51]|uniref:universal stress protein n=1 Tax=Streptomyces sp. H51 TaxID=3111770 RepID=UPI002D7A2CFE|nr:universal stress protein [Streptomyces sp. H51]